MKNFTDQRWQRLDDLLADALTRDPDERSAFLRAACGDDLGLYREALTLLESDEAAADLLGDSAAAFAASLLSEEEQPDGLGPGAHVGPYRIEAEVGRGGMGAVYRARRADGTFDKTVALKLVRRGLDTDEVLARFRRERQVLAALDHPAVARLLDGGAAADGRPYLVMEFVDGHPITAYCDRHRLSVEARLALFEQVGEAVAHAHRRLVVHRDLKPSNVLVGEDEHGQARVKLLDFGIAKLLEADADEALTQPGARRLTPAYAAPEQLRGEPVTTAADVYALGVILYELLAGNRPEMPLKSPSAALTPEAAELRGRATDGLRQRLQGDLDVICLKALREEPEARYPSVEALLDDLHRHRTGLPVAARPASVGYRVRKFIGRHRVGVAAASAVVLALVGGLGVALWQAQAKAREAARAELTRDFALGLFSLADPSETRGEAFTTEHLLDQGAARALDELTGEPEVQEEVLMALAEINYRLSRYENATSLFERVRAQRAARLGPEHPDVAGALNGLAAIAGELGELERADSLYRQLLAIERRHPDRDPLYLASALFNYGALARAQGDLDDAEARHREALALYRLHAGPESPEVAKSSKSLALVKHQRGEYAEAEALYREALALQTRLTGELHPEVGTLYNSLASLRLMRGDYAEADSLYDRALSIQRRLFPSDHRNLVTTMARRSMLPIEQGTPEEAEPLLEEPLAMAQRLFGEHHPSFALPLSNLALALAEQERYAEAAARYEQALAIYRDGLGPEHPSTAAAMANLAWVRLAQGDVPVAEALYREAAAIQETALEAGDPERASALIGLGRVALARRRPADAEPLLRQALALRRSGLGDDHQNTAEAQSWLGACLAAQGRYAEAEPLLTASARVLDHDARRSVEQDVRRNLAAYYDAVGRPADASRYR